MEPKNNALLITALAWTSELWVNLGPGMQSPTAKIFLFEVINYSLTVIPSLSYLMPAFSRSMFSTFGVLPIANRTLSKYSDLYSPFTVKITVPSALNSTIFVSKLNLTPSASIYSCRSLAAIKSSFGRIYFPLTNMVTSVVILANDCPNSDPIGPAPTTSSFFGYTVRLNTVSDVRYSI